MVGREGIGCICYSPLAQGVLTDRYLDGVPEGSRASRSRFLTPADLTDERLRRVHALDAVARRRGGTLAQMALARALRDPRITSATVGASSVEQLEQNVAALERPAFADEELAEIERAIA